MKCSTEYHRTNMDSSSNCTNTNRKHCLQSLVHLEILNSMLKKNILIKEHYVFHGVHLNPTANNILTEKHFRHFFKSTRITHSLELKGLY